MALTDPYITLVSSLPYLHHPFVTRARPLTRVQLNRRLKMLTDADAATLARIENALRWAAIDPLSDNATQAEHARQLVAALPEGTLREAVRRRFELRALVAALRRRRDGKGPPERAAALGYHRRARTIQANWDAASFGLDVDAPWVPDADELLREGDSLELERKLMSLVWDDLVKLARGHLFDFVTVALYVLRWDLIDRWMRYDGEAARARCDALVQAALERYGPVPGLEVTMEREGAAHGR